MITDIKKILPLFLMMFFVPALSNAAFYVAPNGDDNGPGSADKPFRTVEKGIQKALSAPQGDKTVLLYSGTFFLDKTLNFHASHNGLTLAAVPGELPILSGGRQIKNWKTEKGLFVADVSGLDFRFLDINGQAMVRSRLPETGTFLHTSVFKTPWMSSALGGWKTKPTEKELTTMFYQPKDLDPIDDIENTEITLYHEWDETLLRVVAQDKQNHQLTFNMKAAHPAGAFGVKKYVVWNSRHGMTRPGQWYLDRKAGKLYYRPKKGETPESIVGTVPVLERVFFLNKVENLTIRGIGITATTTPLKTGGFGASAFAGAITATNTKNLTLDALEIWSVSGQGINTWNCNGMKIVNCHIYQTGAKGLAAGGLDLLIENNKVHDVGLLYPSAIAVSVSAQGMKKSDRAELEKQNLPSGANLEHLNATIRHNEIFNTPYSGLTCGGGRDVLIEKNRLHHVMQVLGDGAAIYTGGSMFYTLRGNLAYDLDVYEGFGASAYYLDEYTDFSVVEKNVALNVPRPSHNHMTNNNIIRDNIFVVKEGKGTISIARNTNIQLLRNVLVATGDIWVNVHGHDPSRSPLKTGRTVGLSKVEGNIFHTTGGTVYVDENWPNHKVKTTVDQEGKYPGITLANPGLIEGAKQGQISFGNKELTSKNGISPLDVSDAGLLRPVPSRNKR